MITGASRAKVADRALSLVRGSTKIRSRPSRTGDRYFYSTPTSQQAQQLQKDPPHSDLPPGTEGSRAPSSPRAFEDANSKASESSSPPRSKSIDVNSWEENPNFNISKFSELPHTNFGVNQHMVINEEFKEALRQIIWQFRAPIRYAFAYGSGVFPQSGSTAVQGGPSLHPAPAPAIKEVQKGEPKMIDFIFGVSYTQHWHSLNLNQHRDHYSFLGSLGSGVVSRVQDKWGAGVYFNPYVTVNGTLIKYGVVNLDTLCRDLSEWDTLYLAGRLQKPVKILRDDPRVRLANQINLISALRTALLLLPAKFTELELYKTITGISYMGDPRMSLGAENLNKVSNIVTSQLHNFRRLYGPLIENLPNATFNDSRCSSPGWAEDPTTNLSLVQDQNPVKRGNMVRRLPKSFRSKLYFQYQRKWEIPQLDFNRMMEESKDEDSERFMRRQGGPFEQRIATDDHLIEEVETAIKKTIRWPSTSQSLKSGVTAGVGRSLRYLQEKRAKRKAGQAEDKERLERKQEPTKGSEGSESESKES